MYRTGDPRFRRRLNEIGQTLESANEGVQSQLYDFSQIYVKPCLESVSQCFHTCVDAGCPTLTQQRRRPRGRAELSFDFYDDWDEEENDALMGWGGNDEFDRLLAGGGGYGTLEQQQQQQQQQPARQRGMSYPKARRKSTLPSHDGEDPTLIPASSSFLGRLFGGRTKKLKYMPSAAGLQEHPHGKKSGRDITEGEALLREGDEEEEERRRGKRKQHRRLRSDTVTSGHTTDSRSSRGDIFPSDEELDDAIPLDDEFAMVLERRTTETSSGKTRPSTGSRKTSTASSRRGRRKSKADSSSEGQTPPAEGEEEEEERPTLDELKQEERRVEQEEEAVVERKRQEAQKLAVERGLSSSAGSGGGDSFVQTSQDEPPSPSATDNEEGASRSKDGDE